MNTSAEQRFIISNQEGLHLRPASILAKIADGFDSAITVHCNGSEAEAKSVLSMVLLEASFGNEVTVVAKGEDANHAIAAISELFTVGFNWFIEIVSNTNPASDRRRGFSLQSG